MRIGPLFLFSWQTFHSGFYFKLPDSLGCIFPLVSLCTFYRTDWPEEVSSWWNWITNRYSHIPHYQGKGMLSTFWWLGVSDFSFMKCGSPWSVCSGCFGSIEKQKPRWAKVSIRIAWGPPKGKSHLVTSEMALSQLHAISNASWNEQVFHQEKDFAIA